MDNYSARASAMPRYGTRRHPSFYTSTVTYEMLGP